MQLNPTRPNSEVLDLKLVEMVEDDIMLAQLIYLLTETDPGWPWTDDDLPCWTFQLNLRETL
jgi:hypothetical protein